MFNRIITYRIGTALCLFLAAMTCLTDVVACTAVCPVETVREETHPIDEWQDENGAVRPIKRLSFPWRVVARQTIHADVRLNDTSFLKTSLQRQRFYTIAPTAYDYG